MKLLPQFSGLASVLLVSSLLGISNATPLPGFYDLAPGQLIEDISSGQAVARDLPQDMNFDNWGFKRRSVFRREQDNEVNARDESAYYVRLFESAHHSKREGEDSDERVSKRGHVFRRDQDSEVADAEVEPPILVSRMTEEELLKHWRSHFRSRSPASLAQDMNFDNWGFKKRSVFRRDQDDEITQVENQSSNLKTRKTDEEWLNYWGSIVHPGKRQEGLEETEDSAENDMHLKRRMTQREKFIQSLNVFAGKRQEGLKESKEVAEEELSERSLNRIGRIIFRQKVSSVHPLKREPRTPEEILEDWNRLPLFFRRDAPQSSSSLDQALDGPWFKKRDGDLDGEQEDSEEDTSSRQETEAEELSKRGTSDLDVFLNLDRLH